MWQLFDKGLHLFLKNFVYLPIVSSTGSALLGSILSFFTVFYWHGANETCAYWALINWLGVSGPLGFDFLLFGPFNLE